MGRTCNVQNSFFSGTRERGCGVVTCGRIRIGVSVDVQDSQIGKLTMHGTQLWQRDASITSHGDGEGIGLQDNPERFFYLRVRFVDPARGETDVTTIDEPESAERIEVRNPRLVGANQT